MVFFFFFYKTHSKVTGKKLNTLEARKKYWKKFIAEKDDKFVENKLVIGNRKSNFT